MTIKIGREDAGAATMSAIKKATESSQLRLQTLELAVAHLTNICIGLGEDVRSMRSLLLESNAMGEEAVIEMKLPYYSNSNSSSLCSDSKDDLVAKKARQTWRKPLASPHKKEAKASPATKVQGGKARAITVKANPKASMKPAAKGIRPAAPSIQKGSTGSTKAVVIKNMAPTKTNPSTVKESAANTRAKASAPASTKVKTSSTRIAETMTREGPKGEANKAGSRSLPVNVKQGGRASGSGGLTVKLSPQMADSPTIRSLIYGSRAEAVPVKLKKRA